MRDTPSSAKAVSRSESIRLRRYSTVYLPREDRIRLTGEGESGPPLVLWLTQRLLNILLPSLFEWLQRQLPDTPRADLLLGLKQEMARATLEPQQPVSATPESSSRLVESVDINMTEHHLRLTFKDVREREGVILVLGVKALRQWLHILHGQYRRANWPLTVWPTWIAEASGAAEEGRAPVLH